MPLTRAQAREFDRRAMDEFGMPSLLLMENAGRGAAVHMRRVNPEKRRVVVCCGKGNNGGDGFVIARHLDNWGWPVKVLLFADPTELTGDAAVMFRILQKSSVSVSAGRYMLAALRTEDFLNDELTNFDDGWIVDALFGTGLSGSVRDPYDRVIAAMNASPAPIFALDIPSGLDCDTGEPLGTCVRAAITVTFVAMKHGFANEAAQPWLGEVHVVDVGAPRALVEAYTK